MKFIGYIYKHTNKATGKCYIGQSTQPEARRFRKSQKIGNSYKTSIVFYNALQKYGWDQFETEILGYCVDQQSLNDLEEYYIRFYDALVPGGYNTMPKSEGKGAHAESTKLKISEKRKAYYANYEGEIVGPTRKPHRTIDSIECKECSRCSTYLPLSDYSKNSTTWDKIHIYCKSCHRQNMADHRAANPVEPLSDEAWKQSYADRKEAMSEGAKRAFEENPGLRDQISKKNSKAIVGIHVETGVKIEFASALKAKEAGFQNTNIGQAIKLGKPYKSYKWSFKTT